jgi:hypothetical protein
MAELGFGKAKFCQSFHVHDVQATAAIHYAFGELITMDYRAYHHGVISIWDVLWMIVAALVHRYFGPSDVLADFWHGGVEGVHSGSLCLSRGRSKERVKGSFFVFDWVTLASITLCLFAGLGAGSSSISLPSLDSLSLSAFPLQRGRCRRLCLKLAS